MDDPHVGRIVRVLRIRLGWRQADLAERAWVSQTVVSMLERGHLDQMPLRRVRRMLAAVGASADLQIRWRGGEIDRVLDEGHAALVGIVAGELTRLGWTVVPEVSYAHFGEYGSVDLLAWHPDTATLLVVEVKTELTSIEQLLRRHDAKVRLGPRIASDRFSWRARSVSRLLVLPGTSTPRRQVDRHDAVLRRAYPLRGDQVRAWLRAPGAGETGRSAGGILFVSPSAVATGRRRASLPKRVRRAAESS